MQRALPSLVLCVLASGCLTPVPDIECFKDADCAPWFVCSSEGRCVDPSERQADAGRDAGARAVDAGLPPVGVGDGGVNWGNVATDLHGVELGTSQAPNAELSRALTFTAAGDRRFQVVNAQLNRASAGDESGKVLLRVKNVGASGACFIKTEQVVYTGANGSVVHVGGFAYVEGSNGTLEGSQINTDTCLLPGEEGFLVDIILTRDVPGFFSKTTAVRVEFTASTTAFTPTARFVPRSYSFTRQSILATVSIEALNDSGSGLKFDGLVFGLVIPLDDAGRGLSFSFLSGVRDTVIRVRNGESVTLSNQFYDFDGSSSWVYARTGDFEACSTCLRAPWDLATSEGERAFLRALNEAEREKE